MTHTYDSEIASWLVELLANGPNPYVRPLQRPSGQAAPSSLPSCESEIARRTRDLAVPGPYGVPDVTVPVSAPAERDGPLLGLLYIHGGGENALPAGLEDCYPAVAGTATSASELGIDSGCIGVAGETEGTGLAVAVALLARDRGGPALCFQYPGATDLDDRLQTLSTRSYGDALLRNHQVRQGSWDCYLGAGQRGTAHVSPFVSPLRAENPSIRRGPGA
ncbi:alpha/beta hydrolase fold domain-containing protein [Streptomyces griseoviridis]|uniref:alpha/beta hydrolase fold domain-containing protein n=1 Tax=Streptomyces TaxID=1883 RepID=UPI002476F97C|nr:alpha/beta hydrolase fold domain-containing protein [Streptomyces sp. MAA16]MDH6703040.1 acetyl esterase [Streptomyces sp. MAA16]